MSPKQVLKVFSGENGSREDMLASIRALLNKQ
jgi:hypothetical protein